MTSADLVAVGTEGVASLEMLDPSVREAAVTAYLIHARDELARAVEMTGPAAVAQLKAEIATAAEATRQLGLSKEIQSDAQEMVRRAEYALGKAIRTGQESGEIETPTEARSRAAAIREINQGRADQSSLDTLIKPRPKDFATHTELFKQDAGVMDMVDGVTEAQFDAALTDAKAEGNLSRANVVRKIHGVKNDGLTPLERAQRIRDLAPKGYASGQIAAEIGVTEETVKEIAKRHKIEIPADKLLAGTRRLRIDHDHIVNHLTVTLEGLVDGLDRVDINVLDEAQVQHWADSLTQSTRALNRFVKQIKEKAQ